MKILYLLILCSCSSVLFAQSENLVPNPSFEDGLCPYSPIAYPYEFNLLVEEWKASDYSGSVVEDPLPINTPEYFNACGDEELGASVPSNALGHKYARTGDAYAGLACIIYNPEFVPIGFGGETIFTELTEPLQEGIEYEAVMYVSKTEMPAYAKNGIGMAFVEDLPWEGGYITGESRMNLAPDVYANEVITDTDNWVEIKGRFTADGGEKYIVLSTHFYTQSDETEVITTDESVLDIYDPNFLGMTYYYIDDVSVTVATASASSFSNINLKIYPNPTTDIIQIEGDSTFEIKKVSLINLEGKLIRNYHNTRDVISLSDIAAGTYFLQLTLNDGSVYSEKIIKK